MTAETRETLIVATLALLDAAHPYPQSAPQLLIPLKLSGFRELTEPLLASLLLDLEEKGWVKPQASDATGELTRYRRTEDARAFLRRSGF